MTTKPSIALADLLEKGTASPPGECLAPPSNLDGTLVIGRVLFLCAETLEEAKIAPRAAPKRRREPRIRP